LLFTIHPHAIHTYTHAREKYYMALTLPKYTDDALSGIPYIVGIFAVFRVWRQEYYASYGAAKNQHLV
jgi:hypothetical protein